MSIPASRLILLVSAIVSLLGCNKECLKEASPLRYSLETKSGFALSESPVNDWKVLEEDIYAYINTKKEKKDVSSIESYPSDSVSLCYIVNYSEGWEIVSGDKRTPITLAEGETGYYSIELLPELVKTWLDFVCSDIQLLSEIDIESLNLSERERIESNLKIWNKIEHVKPSNREKVKIPDRAFNPPGVWVLQDVFYESEVVDSIHHILSTRWHQDAPFNNYCPLYSPDIPVRCPAGCVAIADAQMLFFLHGKLGVPQSAPTNGLSTGYVYNGTNSFSSWGSSSTVWDYMSTSLVTTSPRDTSAILIAEVGDKLSMEYGLSGSGAPIGTSVFNDYGVYCLCSSYQQDSLKTNLLNGYPVIIGASSSIYGENNHAFIVDGYKRTRLKETERWYWEPNPDYVGVQPHVPGETMDIISYSLPEITRYGINWGIDLSNSYNMSLNNSWYRVDGDWYLGAYNYIWYRIMVFNFQI